MKHHMIGLALSLAVLPLAGCVGNDYGYGGIALGPSPYDGYYDGYYGPIYDGYWGSNGRFYYRSGEQDRRYRSGGRNHFRGPGNSPGGNFRPMQGNTHPPQGAHAPHFPGAGRPGGHGR